MPCDFCGADGIALACFTAPHSYKDMWKGKTLNGKPVSLSLDFDSEWDACSICAAYIDEDKWDALAERADQSFYQSQPGVAREMFRQPQLLIETHQAVHKMFEALKKMGLRRKLESA